MTDTVTSEVSEAGACESEFDAADVASLRDAAEVVARADPRGNRVAATRAADELRRMAARIEALIESRSDDARRETRRRVMARWDDDFLHDPFDFSNDFARGRRRHYGSTPDVRPPYMASYGPDGYDPDANWAAARRSSWGVGSLSGPGHHGMEGRAPMNEVGGFGLEGGYGQAGRGATHYGTANVVAGAGGSYGTGGFEGRGPKGYTRSDARIEEDVNEALTRDPELDASDIEVRVNGGVVELSGKVADRWAKRRAYDDVDDCPGVREVRSALKVER
jgi:osmotically-inducible protein OsmY